MIRDSRLDESQIAIIYFTKTSWDSVADSIQYFIEELLRKRLGISTYS